MAAVDAAGGAVVDVADAETYLGDDASDHGHHAEHGQADEPEAAATQQVNEDLEEEAQFVLLARLLGPGKELAAQEVKVPFFIEPRFLMKHNPKNHTTGLKKPSLR